MAKLKPRARIVRTIGDQLISGPEAAIIELVKNAYDADSPFVRIKITPPSDAFPAGAIQVSDEGHGMSYETIINKWFEPATNDKVLRRLSPKGRLMLGAKGIGRFAASRLGDECYLQSVAAEPDGTRKHMVVIQISWNIFSPDRYLEDIDIPVEVEYFSDGSNEIPEGVSMEISHLRDDWSQERIRRLIRELRRLITSEGSEDYPFRIFLDLSDFTVAACGFDGSEIFEKYNSDVIPQKDPSASYAAYEIIPFRIREFADYRLEGKFQENGAFEGSFQFCRGDNSTVLLNIPALACSEDEEECGEASLSINIYDRETESVEAMFRRMNIEFEDIGIRAARQILNDSSGIAIFRSGFRIRPYGEPENDWLQLERERVQNPSKKLGISQMSGWVEVEDEQTSGLIERSSREGLELNGSFERLVRLVKNVLGHAEELRVSFREKAGISRKKNGDISEVRKLAMLNSVSRALTSIPVEYQQKLVKAVEADSHAISAGLDEIEAYQRLLEERATLGMVVAQVIHEGRRILSPMATSASELSKGWARVQEASAAAEVYRKHFPQHVSRIHKGSTELGRLFKRLDPISGKKRGRPGSFSVPELVNDGLAMLQENIQRSKIEVNNEVPTDLHAYGYPSDLFSALMNILENAVHWLASVDQPSRQIWIKGTQESGRIRLRVRNNGPQIDPAFVERLFQPGFSLKTDGTGLGLAIARVACRSSKGDLVLDETDSETSFSIYFQAVGE